MPNIALIFSLLAAGGTGSRPAPSVFGPTMLLFLLLLAGLGGLLILTLVRWSLRRAGRIERGSGRTGVAPSAWSEAGRRARPMDDAGDGGDS